MHGYVEACTLIDAFACAVRGSGRQLLERKDGRKGWKPPCLGLPDKRSVIFGISTRAPWLASGEFRIHKTHSQKAGIGMHVLGYGDQTPSGLPEYLEMMIKHPMNYCLNTRINIHMNYDEAVL
jgi:hypothetical protein